MKEDENTLEQWLAYRQQNTAHLDIRKAVRDELAGSPLSETEPSQDSQLLKFPLLRIVTSALLRLVALVVWFVATT